MGQKVESATMARNAAVFQRSVGRDRQRRRILSMPSAASMRSATTRVLTEVAEKLSMIRGRRKSILFISEGIDYDISDVMNNRSATAIMDGIRDAIAAATRSNASIYLHRSARPDDDGRRSHRSQYLRRSAADHGIRTILMRRRGNSGPAGHRDQLASRRSCSSRRTAFGRSPTRPTGLLSVNSNDFTSAFERIVSANSAYYVLAYNPPSSRRDGKFHRIDVRMSRPGLTVRARRGYVAPRANKAPSQIRKTTIARRLLRALNTAVPADGLKMRIFAAPFKGVTDQRIGRRRTGAARKRSRAGRQPAGRAGVRGR